MKKLITKEMTIGEVIDEYPATADVLLKTGIHCIGCGARFHETIGEGLKSHGLSDKKMAAVIRELNNVAKAVISVTPKAARKLKEIMKKEKKQDCCLRVQAKNNRYGLDFEKARKKGDTVVREQGLTFVIDEKALPEVRGARIDYAEIPEPGFSIRGPKR